MLSFFRKYHRFFYLGTTAIVIISFSFFGTYNAFSSSPVQDPVAFTDLDGKKVLKSEVEKFSLFLASDAEEKFLYQGAWGPNFLNDGVIKNDFLKTGLAKILIEKFSSELSKDLIQRHQKEKRYSFYVHPEAKFITSAEVWKTLAPTLHENYRLLKQQQKGDEEEAIEAKIALYLQEREFPAPLLKNVLENQLRQYPWIPKDPQFDYLDFSLFGYHSLEDWFGPSFIPLTAEFIINAAKMARQRGYKVTKDEATADLIKNAEESFQRIQNISHTGVSGPQEYMAEQIRRMGLDMGTVQQIWQNVLLFRRLFHDVGNSVALEADEFGKYSEYAKEYVDMDFFRMPEDFLFTDFRKLQKFEIYLDAIAMETKEERKKLGIPKKFLSAETIEKKYPELVQKNYVINVSSIDKNDLGKKISLKEIWKFELDEKNFPLIVEKFPELGLKKKETKEERHEAIANLDKKTKKQLDFFVQKLIVDAHPEWIQEALNHTEKEKKIIGVRKKGSIVPLKGFQKDEKKKEEFFLLLEEAPLVSTSDVSKKEEKALQALQAFSPDDQILYRIEILEKSPYKTALTFKEALKDGTLDYLLTSALKEHYLKIREEDVGVYQRNNGEWKSLKEVQDTVANHYFKDLIKALYQEASLEKGESLSFSNDEVSLYRFSHYLKENKKALRKNLQQEGELFVDATSNKEKDFLNQWLLEKQEKRVLRKDNELSLPWNLVQKDSWSDIFILDSGELSFYYIKDQGVEEADLDGKKRALKAYLTLSFDAEQKLMRKILEEIEKKNAISLSFLQKKTESSDV